MVRYGAGPHDLEWENYDVENDFHGVYFLFGAVGLGLMLAFGVFCAAHPLGAEKRRPEVFHACCRRSVFLSALPLPMPISRLACCAVPIRRSYLSLLLAVIYYLVCIHKYDGKPQWPRGLRAVNRARGRHLPNEIQCGDPGL